jgi:hypothetical protein
MPLVVTGRGGSLGVTSGHVNEHPEQSRVDERAHQLNPEEQAAGSDDPRRQAMVILEDSDERTEHPEDAEVETHID